MIRTIYDDFLDQYQRRVSRVQTALIVDTGERSGAEQKKRRNKRRGKIYSEEALRLRR